MRGQARGGAARARFLPVIAQPPTAEGPEVGAEDHREREPVSQIWLQLIKLHRSKIEKND